MTHSDQLSPDTNRLLAGWLLCLTLVVMAACSESGEEELDLREDAQSYAYNRAGVYSDVLKDCVLVGTVAASCTLETLPVLGQLGTPEPAAIMDRVLVTHDWMGERFEEMLGELPADLLPLFGSTTAIFIGSYVRPSYYSTLNGAIHLDPNFLWLTRAEKATISRSQDPRQEYGAELQFDAFRRFVRDQNYAWRTYSLADQSERDLSDIKLGLARVLYHELAHANDFLPYTEIGALDSKLKVIEAVDSVRESWVSNALTSEQPLNASVLKSLALARYRNDPPSTEEKTIDAAFAGSLMQNDGANYFYGYYTIREDLAGLFEAVMMKVNFDIDMDFAFVSNPDNTDVQCSDYIVGWGVRGRLGNPTVASRAAYVANRILQDPAPVESMLNEQSMIEQYMRPGDDWCENLILDDVAEVSPDGEGQKSISRTPAHTEGKLRETDGQPD